MDLNEKRYVSQWTPPTSARGGGTTGPHRKTYISAFESDDSEYSYQDGEFLDQGSDLDETSRINLSQTFQPNRVTRASSLNQMAWETQSKEIDRFCSAAENAMDWIHHTLTSSRQHAWNLQRKVAVAATRKGRESVGENASGQGQRLVELQETFELVLEEKENIVRELRAEKAGNEKLLRLLHSLEAAAVVSDNGLTKTITVRGEPMHALSSAAASYRPNPSESLLDFQSLRSPGGPSSGIFRQGGSPTHLSGTAADALRPKDEAEKLKDSTLTFLRQQLKTMSFEKDQAQKTVQELEAQVKHLKQLLGERGISGLEQNNTSGLQVLPEHRRPTDGANGRPLQLSTENLRNHVPDRAIETESPAVHPSLLLRPDGSPILSAQQSTTDPFPNINRLGGNSLTDPFPNHPWPPPPQPPAQMAAYATQLSPRGHPTDVSETASNTTTDSPRSLMTSTRGSHASTAARNAWPGFEVSADLVLYGENEEDEEGEEQVAVKAEEGKRAVAVERKSAAGKSGRQVQQFVHSLHSAPPTPIAAPSYSPRVGGARGEEAAKRATVQDMWSSFLQTQRQRGTAAAADSEPTEPAAHSPSHAERAERAEDDGWKVSPAAARAEERGQRAMEGLEGLGEVPPTQRPALAYGAVARGPYAYAEGNGVGIGVRVNGTPPPSRGSPESMSTSQSRMRGVDPGWPDLVASSLERKREAELGLAVSLPREFSLRDRKSVV